MGPALIAAREIGLVRRSTFQLPGRDRVRELVAMKRRRCPTYARGTAANYRQPVNLKILSFALAISGLVAACGPSEKQKAQWAEDRRAECLDKICEGDALPRHDSTGETVLKLNGQWFVGPRNYFSSGMNGAAFFWPSKTPATGAHDFPEKASAVSGYSSNVTIEILLRSNRIPPEPRGYQLIQLAEKNDWIASRRTLRPGLEQVEMKHAIGPRGHAIDHVTYYVATELRGTDGLPPVGTCNHRQVDAGGGTGFMWRDGVWAGVRMNQRHCRDWPEIYQEVTRVLQLLRKA